MPEIKARKIKQATFKQDYLSKTHLSKTDIKARHIKAKLFLYINKYQKKSAISVVLVNLSKRGPTYPIPTHHRGSRG